MSRLRIVCNCPDGSVAVIAPAPEFIEECRIGIVAARTKRGIYQEPLDIYYEVGKFVREPTWRPDLRDDERVRLAVKRVEALAYGGLNELQTLELIRDCDAPPYSTAREIVDYGEIPFDRTYRDAWARSPNGGPIYIDAAKARAIREKRNAA